MLACDDLGNLPLVVYYTQDANAKEDAEDEEEDEEDEDDFSTPRPFNGEWHMSYRDA